MVSPAGSNGTDCYGVRFSFLFSFQEEVQHCVDEHDEQEQHQSDGEQCLSLQAAGIRHFGSHGGGQESDRLEQGVWHVCRIAGNHTNVVLNGVDGTVTYEKQVQYVRDFINTRFEYLQIIFETFPLPGLIFLSDYLLLQEVSLLLFFFDFVMVHSAL